jgi:hypothetical protein
MKIKEIYNELNKLNVKKEIIDEVSSAFINKYDFLNKKFLDAYVKDETILSYILLKILYNGFQNNYDKNYILKLIENNIYGFFDDKEKLIEVKNKLNLILKKLLGTISPFKNFYIIGTFDIEKKFKNYFDYIFYVAPFKIQKGFKKSFAVSYFGKILSIKKNYLIGFIPTKLLEKQEIFLNDNLKYVYFNKLKFKNTDISVIIYNNINNKKLEFFYNDMKKKLDRDDIVFFSSKYIFGEEKQLDEIFKIKKYFTTGCNECFYTKRFYKGKFKKYTQIALVNGKEKPIIFPYDINLRWKKVYKFYDEDELRSFANPVLKHLEKNKDKLKNRNLNSILWFEYNSVKLDNFLKPMIIVSYKIRKKENLIVKRLNGYDKNKKHFYIPIGYSMLIANDEISKYFLNKIDIEKLKEIINDGYLKMDKQGYYIFDINRFKKLKLKDIL